MNRVIPVQLSPFMGLNQVPRRNYVPRRRVFVSASKRKSYDGIKGNLSSSPREGNIISYAAAIEAGESQKIVVSVDNSDKETTVITISGAHQPGLLSLVSSSLHRRDIDVLKANVKTDKTTVNDSFYVVDSDGKQLSSSDAKELETYLQATLQQQDTDTANTQARPQFDAVGTQSVLDSFMDTYTRNDVLSIQEGILNHVEYTLARSKYKFNNFDAYQAAAYSLRDRLIEQWNDTQETYKKLDPKRVYYMSMEFLMGRSLQNALFNLNTKDTYTEALQELGYDLETIIEQERDAALGNGGLGRLAACFLDSMATENLPAWGYGIRYSYGMFRQSLRGGFQHEQPDYWLTQGNPWEIERSQIQYPVYFYGHVSLDNDGNRQTYKWHANECVTAIAFDNPIPGFKTKNTISLRLWAARPGQEFDLEAFNTGDYVAAILNKQRAEAISSVLYPDDRKQEGKELRLKQQHFFVSASLQDVIRRYKDMHQDNFDSFASKVAFQLNDTHPTIAVPELMRLLMDNEGLGWTKAWQITTSVFAFTNHTVLPEALEKWPVDLMQRLLPRHMQLIYDINWRFIQQVTAKYGPDQERIARMSIIEDTSHGKVIRMAYLACVACHTVNGVAEIHSQILKDTVLKDFYELYPDKFQNKTNGVTQRRWLAFCNPPLRELITQSLGSEDWILNLEELSGLRKFVDDPEFITKWREVKLKAKKKAVVKIKQLTGVDVDVNAMFDIQVKRIHEYKRQLMNLFSIIHRYEKIKMMSPEERKSVVPRMVLIGGKAAPGYEVAKRIIKMISAVSDKINNDPEIGDLLKLVFLPDYNVSSAEVVIPAAELSQHISTAGTEASGTGNMKFSMNGSLIIGTMDGANVEIAEEIGEENMFIFGLRADEVEQARSKRASFKPSENFNRVVSLIRTSYFGWGDYFEAVLDTVDGSKSGDYYLLANDFDAYLEAQDKADEIYKDQDKWTKMSIMATAGSGKFSSDRTIREYAKDIWNIEPLERYANKEKKAEEPSKDKK